MGRTVSNRRRATRFDRATPAQQSAFSGQSGKLVLTGKLRSYTGKADLRPYFEEALRRFEKDVAEFRERVALTDGFVLMCNDPEQGSPRSFDALRSQLRRGVLEYARARGLHARPLREWPSDLAVQLIRWMRAEAVKANGEKLSDSTSRKRYGTFCALFAELGEQPKLKALLPELEPFPNNPFSGAHGNGLRTKSLGPSALIAIRLAAIGEFSEAIRKFRYAQKLFDGPEVPPDSSRRGEGQFRNLDAVLWYVKTQYSAKPPKFTALKKTRSDLDRALYEAIARFHGGWRNVSEYLYPSPESYVAPLVLLTIYGHFNTEPLRTIRLKDTRRITVLGGDRMHVRLAVQPGKERGAPYRRSFPVDSNDPAAPESIISFTLDWTKQIRRLAGKYRECIFISVTAQGEVKAFTSAKYDGASGDTKWLHHLKNFCVRHNLPRFNLRELRQTALDYGMQVFGDDIRATFALKGGSSESVIQLHYKSDAARTRASGGIAELQANKELFVRTKGKVHHLGANRKDLSAATPGCRCVDPYDSPIPGQVRGRKCGAFGRCPGCPLGSPDLSAYGLARLLELREAVGKARSDMPMTRWMATWQVVHETLGKKWLPLFAPALFAEAKSMTLPPIGAIE